MVVAWVPVVGGIPLVLVIALLGRRIPMAPARAGRIRTMAAKERMNILN